MQCGTRRGVRPGKRAGVLHQLRAGVPDNQPGAVQCDPGNEVFSMG